MAGKYCIYYGGRWREVCLKTGRIRGFGERTRFVYCKGGRMVATSTATVLKGLRSLVAGKVTTVRLGSATRVKRTQLLQHHHGIYCYHCCTDRIITTQEKHRHDKELPNKIPPHTDAAVQTTQAAEPDSLPADQKEKEKCQSINQTDSEQEIVTQAKMSAPLQTEKTVKHVRNLKRKTRTRSSSQSLKQSSELVEQWKEVLIKADGEDADLYRRYLIKNDPGFDERRFITDSSYMEQIFFQMQPVVIIEKCNLITRMLRRSFGSQENMSQKDFAMNLGLQSLSDQELNTQKRYKMRQRLEKSVESSGCEMNIQNSVLTKRSKEKPTKKTVAEMNKKKMVEAVKRNIKMTRLDRILKTPDLDEFANKQKVKLHSQPKSKNQPVKIKTRPGFREYSNMEDHAIVSWISNGDRARRVNGNRVWTELQSQFAKITGQERTFHSLRNRYLRYILPALGALALPQSLVKRLRAAAAKGAQKHRTSSPYPFDVPQVQSAWAARPRPKESPSPNPSLTIEIKHKSSTPTGKPLTPKPVSPRKPPRRRRDSSDLDDSATQQSQSENRKDKRRHFTSVMDHTGRGPPTDGANSRRLLRSSDAKAREQEQNKNKRKRTRQLYNHKAGFQ